MKAVKNLHKCVRWCPAYKAADKLSKDFLNTIPLISLLAAKCMRERHWEALKTVTKKDFVPPYADKNLIMGGILALNLHEYTNDVEEICDQAVKVRISVFYQSNFQTNKKRTFFTGVKDRDHCKTVRRSLDEYRVANGTIHGHRCAASQDGRGRLRSLGS